MGLMTLRLVWIGPMIMRNGAWTARVRTPWAAHLQQPGAIILNHFDDRPSLRERLRRLHAMRAENDLSD